MLFDKAISAIDNVTEKSICKSLKSREKGRITLIITYYFSTVKGVDKIIFLKKGEVKERGSHTELLNRYRSYYEIWTATDNVNGMEGVKN